MTRNIRATSTGNSIKCYIPGLKNQVDIPFPDRKLPVCKRCKKIYKTRELCRVRDRHTEVPWSTTYICGTLDDSCFNRGSDGELSLVEEGPMRFVAQSVPSPPVPYRSKDNALGGTKSPICMACKDKNYTRHHCRIKNKHLELPWGTVYVTISAVPSAPGAPGFFNDSESQSDSGSIKSKRSFTSTKSESDEPSTKKVKTDGEAAKDDNEEEAAETEANKIETIKDIQSSKAFLLTVGKDDCTLSVSFASLIPPMMVAISMTTYSSNFFSFWTFTQLQWLDVDTSAVEHSANDQQGPWASQHPMDNMYHQPGFYHNGPPPGWSGYNNGFFPGNGNHPAMMPPHSGMGNMPNQNMHPPNGHHNNGIPSSNGMHSGRTTPSEYNQNSNYSSGPYGGDQSHHSQMKPQGQGQQMPFHNYPPHEDRENQGSLTMNQVPGMMNNNMNYPNKPFQQQNQPMNMNEGHMRNQGPPMNRNSPEHDYMPSSKPEYMTNNTNNIVGTIPQPPQPFVPREQGYSGNPPHNNFGRGPPRDNFQPPINAQAGYGGGNMPFYSNQP